MESTTAHGVRLNKEAVNEDDDTEQPADCSGVAGRLCVKSAEVDFFIVNVSLMVLLIG